MPYSNISSISRSLSSAKLFSDLAVMSLLTSSIEIDEILSSELVKHSELTHLNVRLEDIVFSGGLLPLHGWYKRIYVVLAVARVVE